MIRYIPDKVRPVLANISSRWANIRDDVSHDVEHPLMSNKVLYVHQDPSVRAAIEALIQALQKLKRMV